MNKRVGIIDLGSNTTRLIVMSYIAGQQFKLTDEVRETVRLAEGIGADGKLQPAAMARAVAVMRMFANYCSSIGVEAVVPTATSAVREASNQAEFLDQVEHTAGLRMQVLLANEEAYYGFLGTINALPLTDGFLIDIGGGSTQVTNFHNRSFDHAFSRPLGALRISDRYIKSDPISSKDFKALEQAAVDTFGDLDLADNNATALAGIGGTIRTLAEMDMKQRNYSLDRVHGYALRRDNLEAMIEQLRDTTTKQREAIPGLGSDRADLILGGAVILRQLMRQGAFEAITASGYGLREGLFFDYLLPETKPPILDDPRAFSVHNLAQLNTYEPTHVAKVRELALALFDGLQPLHKYGPWERELLDYAAVLHDIGVTISYYDHHKHSEYLVLNGALLGFSHRELILIAQLVRFHRKGDVQADSYSDILEADDVTRIGRLAALLRIAEYLERRKSQVIEHLTVEIGETVVVHTAASGDAAIEIWEANRRTGLFRKAYGRPVEIV